MPIETYKENIIQINRFNVFLNMVEKIKKIKI